MPLGCLFQVSDGLVVISTGISGLENLIKVLLPEERGDSPILISVMRYKHKVLSFSSMFLSKVPISPFCSRLVLGINVHVASAALPKVLNALPDTNSHSCGWAGVLQTPDLAFGSF